MAVFRPFRAVRPAKEYVSEVAALPYDVMSSAEAREMVKGKPWSFLHVDRGEVDLDPSIGIYDRRVYEKAAENLERMLSEGINVRESAPVYYIYRQIMDGRSQAGLVGCASIDDYNNNVIKKHELTRADKEEDRIRHVDTLNANTGPIFLTFRDTIGLRAITEKWMKEHEPLYDFTASDGIRHTVWVIDDADLESDIQEKLGDVPSFYIADGHHRSASAVRVGEKRRAEHPDYDGTEEFNFFLSVLFPVEELRIYDYNRVVKDLNGMDTETFLKACEKSFEISELPVMIKDHASLDEETLSAFRPVSKHTFSLYLDGKWYRLAARKGTFDETDPVGRLDVTILQENLLAPILKIGDPRTDTRISFIGGIRGLNELVRLVDDGAAAAFAMYPTTTDDLMDIADAGKIMPPKSTWFEPKLRSGLFVHYL